ncbi:sugar ABC transporter substrate-binding protein [Paenibacillus physcomitrellae]|uniref:Sugar ABC transporter substrate-binding protein n=1 Tax=Paenibacillus physcomitrellae TaxID=1619311 RepID=A0ABQ1FQX3_9BACL|nr:sugar ABC transporter substrate-binding protein [Paenibacillus physcomitrellae]GGA26079.1 sugar ABC transporter substrate-binding protein [Paenibacillus physcomitrellae]
MSHTRKMLSAVIAVLLLLTITACSGTGQADGGKQTITWWDTMTTEGSVNAINKIISEYEAVHPNVVIKRTYLSYNDIKTKLLLGSIGDKGPDILWIDSADHQTFAAAGVLADITDEVKAWGQADKYVKGPWSSTVYEGRNYGVPVGSNNLALFYNKDMLEQAGLKPPTNWEELQTAAAKLTKGNVFGFAMSAVKTEEGTFQFLPFLLQAGADVTDFDAPGTLKALTLLTDMVNKGYMSREIVTQKQADTATQFAAGKLAMMENGTWQIPFLDQNSKVNWGVVPLPADQQSATVLGGENWAISAASKHKETAFDIIQFANEPDRLKELLKTNGRLPSRGDLLQDPFWQSDERMKVFADSMLDSKARAYGPNYASISEAIQTMMQEAFTGAETPEAAQKKASAAIHKLLEEQQAD